MSNHLETIGKLERLVQIPDIKVSEAELKFLAFYRLFGPASSDEEFLSFSGSNSSDLSFLDSNRVALHDIMDHIGAGRLTNNYDNVDSFEIIPDLDKTFIDDFENIEIWIQDNINLYQEYASLNSPESFKDYYFKSSTKKNIPTDGSRRYIDEMNNEDWKYLFHNYFQMKQANDICKLEIKNLTRKTDKTEDELNLLKTYKSYENDNLNIFDYNIRSKLIEIMPKVLRQHVFHHHIRLNTYKWVETWIDALLEHKEKIPTIQDAVLEENAILNQTFKENPEYFDVAKNSNEYRKLLDEQETLTRRIQSKVNILLKKLTPFESQRVLLLKKLKIWELRNGYSKLHGNGNVDYNQWLDLTRDQFTRV